MFHQHLYFSWHYAMSTKGNNGVAGNLESSALFLCVFVIVWHANDTSIKKNLSHKGASFSLPVSCFTGISPKEDKS